MNALALAELFRASFESDPAFAARKCVNDQTAEGILRPSLVVAVTSRSFSATGSAFSYTLTVWVETSADRTDSLPDPAAAHASAVDLVNQKLFGLRGHADTEVIAGAPTPRGTQLMAALNAAAIFDFRGWSCADSDPGIESHHFRTPVILTGCAVVL